MMVTSKIFEKLTLIEGRYAQLRFENRQQLACARFDTREHYRHLPQADYAPIEPGTAWGDDGVTMWLKAQVTIPQELDGCRVFIRYCNSLAETLFEANGKHLGVFDKNHPVVMLENCAQAGDSYTLGFEAYSGHNFPGCHADDVVEVDSARTVPPGCRTFEGVWLCTEERDVTRFVFDLHTLLQQQALLEDASLRKGELARCLQAVFALVDALPAETGKDSWLPKLRQAIGVMAPLMEKKNGSTAPTCITMGHSHIDSAWQWTLDETQRKCARTFSSVLNLMDQYPDFVFMQSAPRHAQWMQESYPDIFQRICQRVKEGRWEPNGAMYVEPDCNLTSGESLVRQLLYGQSYTRKTFGYTADTLWLPDTFGYSVALPQLLQQAHVKNFCTSKIYWNDTTRFPYDSFLWKGLDGTAVKASFHKVHFHPDPATLHWLWSDTVQHKDVQPAFLAPFGFGDGGGGPMNEMIEEAARLQDLEGSPRTRFGTVSEYMDLLDADLLPVYSGELYLELHRGTLTSLAANKKGNRRCEIVLHNLEYLAARSGLPYPKAQLDRFWQTLLVNQFHDILPGTSIEAVNVRAQREFAEILAGASDEIRAIGREAKKEDRGLTLVNTLSWDRTGPVVLRDLPRGTVVQGLPCQAIRTLEGEQALLVDGLIIPATGSAYLTLGGEPQVQSSPFRYDGQTLTTPFHRIRFSETGVIASLEDRQTGREYVTRGGAFNQFISGEDAPTYWDNWDINAEQQLKRHPDGRLLRRTVTADGPVTLRLESVYQVGDRSTLTQTMAVYASDPRIDFETELDWQEKHVLLQVAFDTEVASEYVLNETQFGHIARPTHRNQPADQARFEVPNQKWSDLSDNGFGVALLNDCKYGVSANGGQLALTLIKSGVHPDTNGDRGLHRFTYSILPHECGFSVPAVVRPAYELNMAPIQMEGRVCAFDQLLQIDKDSIILETVKQSEDANTLILRFYEAGRAAGKASIRFTQPVKAVQEVNLLEEPVAEVAVADNAVCLHFRAFEVKTLAVTF